MNAFVNNVLTELTSNAKLAKQPLVSMLIESTQKSIALNENSDSIYSSLRSGLSAINNRLKRTDISKILKDFEENEVTPATVFEKIANEVDLRKKVATLKATNSYKTPIIKTKVDELFGLIESGQPQFQYCRGFIEQFTEYNYDPNVSKAVNEVTAYLLENKAKLTMLSSIYQMDMVQNVMYKGIVPGLREMLINDAYSSDAIKMKYGINLPLVTRLVEQLKIIESEDGGDFTLGAGNADTTIKNIITPSIQIDEGILMYLDNRFISVREAKGLVGNEKNVLIDESFKIAEVDPEYVKNKYNDFYTLAESFVTLGFVVSDSGDKVVSTKLRNMNIGLKINEDKKLDLYFNGTPAGEKEDAIKNISEKIVMETPATKSKVFKIIERADEIVNFEFIKEISNSITLAESYVFDLNKTYFVCEKLNAVERSWKQLDEYELYELFKTKYKYDISKVFETKIKEAEYSKRKIEQDKEAVNVDIVKLTESSEKLTAALSDPSIDDDKKVKLTDLKEAVDAQILSYKEQYLKLDALKKREVTPTPKSKEVA